MRRTVTQHKIAGLEHAESGLSTRDVDERRARYGYNDVIETRPTGWREVFRDTVKDPMLWFLAGTSGLFAVVGDLTQALVMLGAIAPLVGMDAFLHRRTQASTQGLRSRLAENAHAFRDGRWMEVRALELVPGDLVRATPGVSFPADGLIIGGESLQVDESALTGESFPVGKTTFTIGSVPQIDEVLVDGQHWGFAGTRLLTGEARVRVVDTGAATVYGEIVRSAVQGAHARTPLQLAIDHLVVRLLWAAAALCIVLAGIRWQQGHGIVDALTSAATLAVAALPEEFPIVLTFSLGVGIFRLARHQALVRRAVVVENIGRVTCICTDKTGTLTEGRIQVAHYVPAAGMSETDLAAIAALASRAESGDPLDQALLETGRGESLGLERLATFPFTEGRRRETAAFRARDGIVVVSKGAPETILSVCRLTPEERAIWSARVLELAAGAHKVVACASRRFTESSWSGAEPDRDYELSGLIACEDPVREGVVDAVREASAAGIRVIMVTGDHVATAEAVAREVGIGGRAPRTIEGDRLEAELAANDIGGLIDMDVIARAVPAQKLRIVQALQRQGEIVAVTGDGVNDVPALHAADIGIAMGERGTRAARDASAVVLLDDNFRTIVHAIREGRQLFRNLRGAFAYLLMIHIPLVATATLIPLAGYPLLYLPIHVVWLELIIHPTALLVFQASSAPTVLEPMRKRLRRRRFFSGWEQLVVWAAGTAITLTVLFGYDRSLGAGGNVEHARAMALVTLVTASATLVSALNGLRTRVARSVAAATAASAVILVQVPSLAALLHVAPLDWADWAIATIGGLFAGAIGALFAWRGPRATRSAG